MNRREALHVMGAVTLTSLAAPTKAAAKRAGASPADGGYFLSKTNPLATAEQRELESMALQVARMPAVLNARKGVALQWRAAAGMNPGPQAWAQFDDMIEEYVFLNVLKAVNADPNYPKILGMVFSMPHEWFGMKMPGSRVAGPNPDNAYRQIPVDPAARYEITGRCFDPAPADFGFTLMSNLMFTRKLPLLQKRDLKVEADGTFKITLGPEAAKGRPNHLQMPPSTRWFYVRDSRSDWKQIPNALRVRRLDAPTARPLSMEQIADLAAAFMIDDLPGSYWWMAVSRQAEVNTMTQPDNTGGVGGLASQQTSFGYAKLADDEALVVTVSPGGAAYRSLSLYDYWYRTVEPAKYMSSLTNQQALPNADGSATHVISSRDPGVHNWLDTGGQRELLILNRWQGLPSERLPENRLFVETRLVKLDDLPKALPSGMKTVTAQERQQQLAERFAQYRLRYVDS